MPRWPAGLHVQAGATPNTGQRAYAIPRPAMDAYGYWVRGTLDQGASVILNSSGAGFAVLAPPGWGTRWGITSLQVSTTTGPADQSQCQLYEGAVADSRKLGQTAQGGGDTIAFTRLISYGETLVAVWSQGNPGDTATLVLHGWKEGLA